MLVTDRRYAALLGFVGEQELAEPRSLGLMGGNGMTYCRPTRRPILIGVGIRRIVVLVVLVGAVLTIPSCSQFSSSSGRGVSPTVVSSGSAVLKGTYYFDLDTGTEGSAGSNFDIWWEQKTAVLRDMAPIKINGAQIVNLGSVNYASLTPDALSSLTYSTTPIDGNNDASNKLVTGDVFAVKTTSGNFAKVLVVDYGYDMSIQWTTYKLDHSMPYSERATTIPRT
jgi:hypothetical protein